jgi:hypothetical protein
MSNTADPQFFATPAQFRRRLAKHQATRQRRLAWLIEHGDRGALLVPFSRR